jgi:hypothetical protein
MHLDRHRVYIRSKSNESRKARTPYKLEQREFCDLLETNFEMCYT